MVPYAAVDHNPTSEVDSNTFTMSNPMPESTLSSSQGLMILDDWATPCLSWLQLHTSWHYLPYNDYEFMLWKRRTVAAGDRVKKSNAAAAEKRWHVCIKPLLLPCLLCIFFLKLTFEVGVFSAASPHLFCILVNEANLFCFLSSLPVLSPATTAVFGSYLSCQSKRR
jgi:hypothetical protein